MYNVIISVPVRIAKGNEISAQCQRDHEGWTHEHDLTFSGYFEWCILKTRSYQHAVIDHATKYVDGRVHTNGIENFWSLLKRGIIGIYHSVDVDHLDRYLDEFSYRYNTKGDTDSERFVRTARMLAGKRLTWDALTAKV